MRRLLFVGWLALCLIPTARAGDLVSRYVAGRDYRIATHAGPARRDGRVRVTEFFLYSCPHCFHFEPRLNAWRRHHPEVAFARVPVLFGPGARGYARLYYTEAALGVVARCHDPIFDAIHRRGQPLDTAAAQKRFLADCGVAPARFDAAYRSHRVRRALRRVAGRMRRYPVTAVPSFSVAGRYWTSGRLAGSNARMLKVVDYLVARARHAVR